MAAVPKIMIVDDELFNLDVLEQELETLGYDIVTANNGEEALQNIDSAAPDLILLDIIMPGIDGYEVCRRLAATDTSNDIPVIFMTALSDAQDKVKAFEAGGVDYITKPFQPEEVLARVKTHLELRRTRQELTEQNTQLRQEIEAHRRAQQAVDYLREEIKTGHNFEEIIGDSPALNNALDKLAQVAETDTTVLIQGETGTGKELFARAVHNRSPRNPHPLIKVNCAALPRDLIESELFGHEKGAFTGATQQRKGRFELADKGTIFLDEVAELSAEAQAKLLRVLQEQEFERVGGTESVRVDVRVIAATNRELEADIETSAFRVDLFYRLNVFPVTVPPLRDRVSDIALLAQHFLNKFARTLGKHFTGIDAPSLVELTRYSWRGNVRELENVIERSAILSPGPLLKIEPLVAATGTKTLTSGTLEDVERAYVTEVLERTHWAIEGDQGAAAALGLNPSTLRGRMRKLGIEKSG